MATTAGILGAAGLGRFEAAFEENGLDDLETLFAYDVDDDLDPHEV